MGSSCSTITVVSGDSCASLASRCGISAANFTMYNPSPTLCSTLAVGQKVCCSAGGLPVPEQNPDGSCASYLVVAGDTCSVIALGNSITVDDLETWNTQTWGWEGCANLQAGENMCLSTGTPPMPAPLANAVCGPQVPGTANPGPGANLSTLNSCPLNACCDIWGQCGTTSDFCTPSGTGAPGTAAPGTNGCISNCGTDIVIGLPPAEFRRIAYFETFNLDRPCLNMDISQIDTSQYTHIHFAFLDLTSDFNVDITQYRDQFDNLVELTGVKRIASFGGWTMSTDPDTYSIFRNAVSAANRQTFASNLVSFVNQWGLDGVDIDWEYPGEQDIPGIPAGSAGDGQNLAAFVVLLKSLLGPSKSLSIATPASYWYLKAFPIGVMAESLDYIVYMTYDLHGQWDYGNAFSDVGCPAGNCLRSHVNLTETLNALSMVTKAGVNTSKLVVGVTSYGRTFQMTTPGCTGPMCTYTGPASGAAAGPCTQTPGYIANAEINQIITNDASAQTFHDTDSDSDILVYDSVQWVAYMNNATKGTRTTLYQSLNMGGVSDWAVDLQKYLDPPSPPTPSAPAESSTPTDPIGPNGQMNPYLRNCTQEQSDMIIEAWEEAAILAQGHYEWWPGGAFYSQKWQSAMTLYIGANSQNDFSWITGKGPLYKNVENQYNIHYGGSFSNPIFTYAYFYCYEPNIPKANNPKWKPTCVPNGNVTAYTWDDLGTFWSAHYVVMCPLWFSARLTSLQAKTETANGDITMQTTMDYWRPVRARSLFHETYHWGTTVSVPRCLDFAYKPLSVTNLAVSNQSASVINAESWAQAAMAIYLQKTFHLSDPPLPEGYRSGTASTIDGVDLVEMLLDAPPDEWDPPVLNTNATYNPDMTNVILLSGVGALSGTGGEPCTNGLWQDLEACQTFCFDGTCIQSASNASFVCSGCVTGPPTPVCIPGSYSDFDHCWASCTNGLCSENAGESGIQCEDCPS